VELLEDRSLLSATGSTVAELLHFNLAHNPNQGNRPAAEHRLQNFGEGRSFSRSAEAVEVSPGVSSASGLRRGALKHDEKDQTNQPEFADSTYGIISGFDGAATSVAFSHTVVGSSIGQSAFYAPVATRSDFDSPWDPFSAQVNQPAFSFAGGYPASSVFILFFEPFAGRFISVDLDLDLQPQRTVLQSYSQNAFASEAFDVLPAGLQAVRLYGPLRSELAADAGTASAPGNSVSLQLKPVEIVTAPQDRHQVATNVGQLASATPLVQLNRIVESGTVRPDTRELATPLAESQRPGAAPASAVPVPRSVESSLAGTAAAEPRAPSQPVGPLPEQAPDKSLLPGRKEEIT